MGGARLASGVAVPPMPPPFVSSDGGGKLHLTNRLMYCILYIEVMNYVRILQNGTAPAVHTERN